MECLTNLRRKANLRCRLYLPEVLQLGQIDLEVNRSLHCLPLTNIIPATNHLNPEFKATMLDKSDPASNLNPKRPLHLRRRFRKLLRILYEYHKERADARKRAAAKAGRRGRSCRRVVEEKDDVDDEEEMYGGYIPLTRENLFGGWKRD